MNYLSKPHTEQQLEALAVGGNTTIAGAEFCSLRAHVRKAVELGDIRQPLTGVQIAGLNKATCIAILLGQEAPALTPLPEPDDSNTVKALKATPTPTPPPPAAAPSNAQPAVEQAFAVLAQAFGGKVSSEEIKQQVADITRPEMEKLRDVAGMMLQAIEASKQENEKLRAELRAGTPQLIEVRTEDGGNIRKVGRQHFLFPLLLKIMASRSHAYLAGPAGSFKTSTSHAAAESLGLPFYATSVCQQTTKTDLLGFFVPGTGQYMPTDFRRAFENGGVFLLDEIDAGNANVLAVLNAALANSAMGFPDGMIQRHRDFILIAAGNTYGQGANREYVGRNQLDAATLDRFAFVDFPYDTGLEAEYCGVSGRPSPAVNLSQGGTPTADAWLDRVAAVRASAEKQKIRAVFSTRASIMGVKLAAQGIGQSWLEKLLLWKGLDQATKDKITAGI
jgi:cobaltochelatase CobS